MILAGVIAEEKVGGAAGPTFVQSILNVFPSTSFTFSGVGAGDLLVAAFYPSGSVVPLDITDTSGDGKDWHIILSPSPFDSVHVVNAYLAYKHAGTSGTYTGTITLSAPTGFLQILGAEWSGIPGLAAVLNGDVNAVGSTVIDCQTLASVPASALSIIFGEHAGTACTFTPSAGYTSRLGGSINGFFGIADKVLGSPGSESPTLTMSVSQHWLGLGVAFNAAAVGDGYSAALLTDQPIAYYRLDDSSSAMTDKGGNLSTGSYTSSPTQNVTSLIVNSSDKATTFNGSSQYGEAGIGYADITQAFSVEFAMNASSLAATGQPVSWRGGASALMGIQVLTSGKIRVFWFDSGGSYQFVESTSTISAGTTYLCVLSVAAGGAFTFYVNNVSFITGTMTSVHTWSNTTTLRIGAGANGGSLTFTEGFAGTVDEVAFYRRGLNSTQVGNHWTASGN